MRIKRLNVFALVLSLANFAIGQGITGGGSGAGATIWGSTALAISANSVTFGSAAGVSVWTLTLTANVTSSSCPTSGTTGALYVLHLIQDGTGGRSFSAPSCFANFPSVVAQEAGVATDTLMRFDGTSFQYLTSANLSGHGIAAETTNPTSNPATGTGYPYFSSVFHEWDYLDSLGLTHAMNAPMFLPVINTSEATDKLTANSGNQYFSVSSGAANFPAAALVSGRHFTLQAWIDQVVSATNSNATYNFVLCNTPTCNSTVVPLTAYALGAAICFVNGTCGWQLTVECLVTATPGDLICGQSTNSFWVSTTAGTRGNSASTLITGVPTSGTIYANVQYNQTTQAGNTGSLMGMRGVFD